MHPCLREKRPLKAKVQKISFGAIHPDTDMADSLNILFCSKLS